MAAPSGEKMKSVKIELEEEAPEVMVMSVGETLCKEHWKKVVELVQESKRDCAACKACKRVERSIPDVKKEIKLEEIAGSSSKVKGEPRELILPKVEPKEEPTIPEADPMIGEPEILPIPVEEEEEHDPDVPLFGGDVEVADDVAEEDEDEDEMEADDEMEDSSEFSFSTTTGVDNDEMDMDGPDSEEEYRTPSDDEWEEEEQEYEPTDSNAKEARKLLS